jgi:hypothetical protein
MYLGFISLTIAKNCSHLAETCILCKIILCSHTTNQSLLGGSQSSSLQPSIHQNYHRRMHDQRTHQAKEDSEHDNKTEVTDEYETARGQQRTKATYGGDP